MRVYADVLIDEEISRAEDAALRRDLRRWERDIEQPYGVQTWYGRFRDSDSDWSAPSTASGSPPSW